jgi:hypothetical protein
MATSKKKAASPQLASGPEPYPRITDRASRFYGLLDDTKLTQHKIVISSEKLDALILSAIAYANRKSSREVVSIPVGTSPEQVVEIYKKEGIELLKYFKTYANDPASTAYKTYKKNYKDVAIELFRNKTLQRERMNSGWRYQFLAVSCARETRRFNGVSGMNTAEADFNAEIDTLNPGDDPVNLYVSVKNRADTLGGQDWPKAIYALEMAARTDQNKIGPYCCVFGIAMERGQRKQIRQKKTNVAYSVNTEVWFSDFFWPFFANRSYEDIMLNVFEVLSTGTSPEEEELATQLEVPEELLDSFRQKCHEAGLINDVGDFHDPKKLINFLCTKQVPAKRPKKAKKAKKA